jgi:hypothetical protein
VTSNRTRFESLGGRQSAKASADDDHFPRFTHNHLFLVHGFSTGPAIWKGNPSCQRSAIQNEVGYEELVGSVDWCRVSDTGRRRVLRQ